MKWATSESSDGKQWREWDIFTTYNVLDVLSFEPLCSGHCAK